MDAIQDDVILQLPGGIQVRTLRLEDAKSVSHHASNPKIHANLTDRMPQPYKVEDAIWWCKFLSNPENGNRSGKWTPEGGSEGPILPPGHTIAINGEAVGSIGLKFGDDVHRRDAELGYWLSEDHWGKGVMSKVAKAYVEWAFRTYDILVRISSEIYDWNKASEKVLTKAGFVHEGHKPNAAFKKGKLIGITLYGALRPE